MLGRKLRTSRWAQAALALTLMVTASGSASVATQAATAPPDAIDGVGDGRGYRLYGLHADASTARWEPLATLRPSSAVEDVWLGYHCLSGDGRWAAAVVAPRRAVNVPVLRDRGATAYRVNTRTGAVALLAQGVGFKYHTLGCGRGDRIAITRSLGVDQAATEVLEYDLRSRRLLRGFRVPSQVTSVVPTRGGLLGVRGSHILALDAGRAEAVATVRGVPYDLRPAGDGVDLLATRGAAKADVLQLRGGVLRRAGRGPRGRLGLELGAAGRNVVVAGRPTRGDTRLRWARAGAAGVASAASRDGRIMLVQRPRAGSAARHRRAAGSLPRVVVARDGRALATTIALGAGRPHTAATADEPLARGAANTTTPKCAVPRNSLTRQVPQPNSQQVDWAIQQAVRGALRGATLTRPSNFLNMGLASYQPSSDFAPGSLQGGTAGAVVPPSVVQALYAQESNWWQASWHALPGVAGNPLVGDYYGANGGISTIDYDQADCGYGVSQLTDGMSAASTLLSANGKTKVAVDYAENVAAGLQVLIAKWNQLAQAGVTVNGGDPRYLENWYFALWAYNTGFHANTGSGPWGLGWTNNPQNSDYPPNRAPFLRLTYADAEHPGDWPYQERVLGFMESPLINYKGYRSYRASPMLALPSASLFCTASNECSPTYHDPVDATKDYCRRVDRKCWWRTPVTWTSCATACHQSQFTYATTATEPAPDPTYLPQCSSSLAGGAIIVDNQPSKLNVRGCGSSNWSSQGSFTITHGQDAAGTPIGQIDWHQLGTGFGGHAYFTHGRTASDAAHLETGTWTPPSLTAGSYAIAVHVPVSGATTRAATYRVYPGDGTSQTVTINQNVGGNQWIPLGNFYLRPTGARVVLTNVTPETPGTTDVAYDAVAFTYIRAPKPADANLAASFAPLLRFDSSEKWRPLNVATLFGERDAGGLPLHRRCLPYDSPDAARLLGVSQYPTTAGPDDYSVPQSSGGQTVFIPVARCPRTGSLADAISWRSPDAYVDLQQLGPSTSQGDFSSPDARCHVGILLDCNGNEIAGDDKSAIYYYVTETSGYAYVQYWMFYRYNSYSDSISTGKHEGDWEAVAVAPSLDGTTFDFASFSQHGAWFSYLRANLRCGDQADLSCGTSTVHRGKRLISYVSNGSHANYPLACQEVVAELSCVRGTGAPERGYDGAKPWGHNAGGGLLAMPVLGISGWSDWPGHWGATGSGPFAPGTAAPGSPAAQGMFNRPWGGCGSNDSGCAVPASSRRAPLARTSAPTASRSCESWFGGGVAALACAPSSLRRAVAHRRMGREGTLTLRAVRQGASGRARSLWHEASADGVSQVMGAPLVAGDRLVLEGSAARGTAVRVRVLAGPQRLRSLRIALPAGRLSGTTIHVVGAGARLRLALER